MDYVSLAVTILGIVVTLGATFMPSIKKRSVSSPPILKRELELLERLKSEPAHSFQQRYVDREVARMVLRKEGTSEPMFGLAFSFQGYPLRFSGYLFF